VQHHVTSLDDPVTVALALNKPLVYRLLSKQQLRTPAYCEFTLSSVSKALNFIKTSGGECVVKPARGSGGDGVTTGVRSRVHLAQAAASASAYDSQLLIEEQIEGNVYRLLYIDGHLLDAAQRKAPTAIANGISTVRELIRRENESRLSQVSKLTHCLIEPDVDMHRTLAKQGLKLSSVPEQGRTINLKGVINANSQLDNASAKDLLCQSIIDDGAAAAAAVGVRFAGIDLITNDPSVPLSQSGGAILEVNTTPGFYHHYYKRDGSFPVAIHILPYLLPLRQSERPVTPEYLERISHV
jgi:cyanophycin synthetase